MTLLPPDYPKRDGPPTESQHEDDLRIAGERIAWRNGFLMACLIALIVAGVVWKIQNPTPF